MSFLLAHLNHTATRIEQARKAFLCGGDLSRRESRAAAEQEAFGADRLTEAESEEEVHEPVVNRCAACGKTIGEIAIIPDGGGYACSAACERKLANVDALMRREVGQMVDNLLASLTPDPAVIATIERQLAALQHVPADLAASGNQPGRSDAPVPPAGHLLREHADDVLPVITQVLKQYWNDRKLSQIILDATATALDALT